MQVSPIGMASASQADFGGSDSRHLLQFNGRTLSVRPFFLSKKSFFLIKNSFNR